MKLTLLFKTLKRGSALLCLVLFLSSSSEIIAQTPELVYDNKKNFGNDNFTMTDFSQRWIHAKTMADDKKGLKGNTGTARNINACGNIAYDAENVRRCVSTGSFIVNYTGFTPEAQEAFQYAVDIWSKVLNLTVPIEINADFAPLAPGVLGQAGPDQFWTVAGQGNVVFAAALADQLAGVDLGGSDMSMTFSSTFPFYTGLDGCPAPGEFDLATVILHEIGHGLGFLSSDFVFGAGQFSFLFGAGHPAGACVGFRGAGGQPTPYIYDLYLNSAGFGGTPYDALAGLTPFPGTLGGFPLADFGCYIGLDQYYTNNDLTITGPELQGCLGGPAQIFAPNPYRPGSSISHFDEATYPGVHPNSLMTPSIGFGLANHDPGCALSVLKDLGYEVNDYQPGNILTVGECLPPEPPIPTMGEWALMIFGLLIVNMSVFFLRRKENILA